MINSMIASKHVSVEITSQVGISATDLNANFALSVLDVNSNVIPWGRLVYM